MERTLKRWTEVVTDFWNVVGQKINPATKMEVSFSAQRTWMTVFDIGGCGYACFTASKATSYILVEYKIK